MSACLKCNEAYERGCRAGEIAERARIRAAVVAEQDKVMTEWTRLDHETQQWEKAINIGVTEALADLLRLIDDAGGER